MARTPLYLTVAETLRSRIEAGEWQPGERLPNENDLARELYVSRVTLREALGLLERDGVIIRQHGRGSFVHRKPIHVAGQLEKLQPFARVIQQAGYATSEEILDLKPAQLPPEAAARLLVPAGTQGYRLEMVRHMENVPVIFSEDYIRADGIDPDEFRQLGRNILDYLAETGRPPVAYSYLTVTAVLLRGRELDVLQSPPLEPVVQLHGTAYTADGRPLFVTRFLVRTKHYELTLLRRSDQDADEKESSR